MMHNLILTRFLVSAKKWRGERREFKLLQVRTCYEVGSDYPSVEVVKEGKKERVKVIPDAWLGGEAVMVAYLTTGETEGFRESRRRAMCVWAQEVLKELRKESWASVFRFGSVSMEDMYEGALFEKDVWYMPGEETPVGLFVG
jgi:hypothetical protein